MKNQSVASGLKVLFSVVLIIAVIMVVSEFSGISLFSSLVGFVTTPIAQFSSNALKSEVSPISGKTIEELEAENIALNEKLKDMANLTADYYDIKRQNEQNVKYLELKEQQNDYKFTSASVVGRGALDMFYNFTLDKGSMSDIEEYDPVITDKGIVGYVSEVHQTYSKVTSILSPESKISVINSRTQESGIASGSAKYADRGVIVLNFISAESKIEKGDVLTASGIGGVYPKSLLVGEVEDIILKENSAEKEIIVRPYEDVQNVRDVFVITDFIGQGVTVLE